MEASPLNCQDAVRRLDDFVDRELDAEELTQVQHHLEHCSHCAAAFAFEASLLAELKQKLRRIAAPPQLLQRILERLDQGGSPPAG
jgi:anti-sigma factor (TIGR02949 family)